MDHIFIYALPTNNTKEARILEISAVRAEGFACRKQDMRETFTGKSESNSRKLLSDMREKIYTSNPFVVVSYCSEITRTLLRNEYANSGLEDMFAGRAWIDINQLAWPLAAGRFIQSRTLDSLCKHFKITLEPQADSADICVAMIQIYRGMMQRYRTALSGEEAIREVGGETLENVRKIMGF